MEKQGITQYCRYCSFCIYGNVPYCTDHVADISKKVEGDCISRQAAKNKKVYSEERHEYVVPVAELDWLPSAQPEPSIPLSWIEGQIEWLRSLDDAFASMTAGQISAMVEKWKGEQESR